MTLRLSLMLNSKSRVDSPLIRTWLVLSGMCRLHIRVETASLLYSGITAVFRPWDFHDSRPTTNFMLVVCFCNQGTSHPPPNPDT